MLTYISRPLIIILLLCGLSRALIRLDSIAIHPADVELDFPDFSPCTLETKESAVGVFHNHFWPKINKSGRSTYEITKCLEREGDSAALGKDYEIVVQINSRSCTFKLKHDPTKPLEAQELLNDIEEQIKVCAQGQEHNLPAEVIPAPEPKDSADEDHLKMVNDLLKEDDEEPLSPAAPKTGDQKSQKNIKDVPYIFNKEHLKLYDSSFEPFAHDVDDASKASYWDTLKHFSNISDKKIEDDFNSDDEEQAFLEDQRRWIKEKIKLDQQEQKAKPEDKKEELPYNFELPDIWKEEDAPVIENPNEIDSSKNKNVPKAHEDDEDDISDEEEEKYLNDLRKEIKQKYEAVRKIDPRLDDKEKEEIKDELENQILDETAIYNKALEKLSQSKIEVQPQAEQKPEEKDDLLDEIPEIVHRPHIKVWLPCSAEEKQRVIGYFTQLISEDLLRPVVIYKQNLKGCFTMQMHPNTLEVQLSFNFNVCNFILKKQENEMIELEDNAEIRTGNCRKMIGSRLKKE